MNSRTKVFYLFLCCFVLTVAGVSAQAPDRQVITAENAADLALTQTLGYAYSTDTVFSPNGRYFAVGTSAWIVLYDAADFTAAPRLIEGGTHSIAFSPDGARIAVTNRILDVETGATLLTFDGYFPLFTSDGSRIIAAYSEEFFVMDAATGEEFLRQSVGGRVDEIRLSPDDNTIAITLQNDGVYFWNSKTGMPSIALAPAQYPNIFSGNTAFSPDGSLFIVAGWDGYSMRNALTGELLREVDSYFNPDLNAVAFTPDGSQIAIGDGNGGIRFYETDTGGSLGSFGQNQEIRTIALSPDGKLLAAAARNGVIKVWDRTSNETVATLNGFGIRMDAIGFDDADAIVSAASVEGTTWQWNTETGEQLGVAQRYFYGATHGTYPYPSSVTLNENGNLLATGNVISGIIHLWATDGRSRGNLEIGLGQDIRAAAISPDSRLIAASGFRNIYVWNLETGTRLTGLLVRDRYVTNIAFGRDGSTIAIGDGEGRVTLQDRTTARVLAEFQGAAGDVDNIAFSPDNSILAFTSYCWREANCGDDDIRLWDAHTGELLHQFQGHTNTVEAFDFSPDGSILASIGGGTMRLWDVTTGEELISVPAAGWSLAFDNSGTRIVIGSSDGRIQLWSIPG